MEQETLSSIQHLSSLLTELAKSGASQVQEESATVISAGQKALAAYNREARQALTILINRVEQDLRDRKARKGTILANFFDNMLVRAGAIASSVLYDAYTHYCIEKDSEAVSTREFSTFMLTKGIAKTRRSAGVYYKVSLKPVLPSVFTNAAPLFRSLIPEAFEKGQNLTRPWIKQRVEKILSTATDPVDPDTITGIESVRDLVPLSLLADSIDIDGWCKEQGEALSSLALHAAVGFDQLWITGPPPTTFSDLMRCYFFILRSKRVEVRAPSDTFSPYVPSETDIPEELRHRGDDLVSVCDHAHK